MKIKLKIILMLLFAFVFHEASSHNTTSLSRQNWKNANLIVVTLESRTVGIYTFNKSNEPSIFYANTIILKQ